MASQPGSQPRWGTVGAAKITTPSSTQQDVGWDVTGSAAFPDGKPVLQIANWFYNLAYQWIAWFAQAIYRPLAVWADAQIVDGDTLLPSEFIGPTWPRSTTVPAAWFTGAAIILGNYARVASPADTLPDSSDVYVDLGPDGVWDFNAVGNGAGAPALGANHVRFFIFVTNGASQITAGTYQKAGANYIENATIIRLDAGAIIDGNEGISVDEEAGGSDFAYVLHDGSWQAASSTGAATPELNSALGLMMFEDAAQPGAIGQHAWVVATNCRYRVATNDWERNAAEDAYVFVFYSEGLLILHHEATDSSTWANTIAATTWIVRGQYGEAGQGVNNANMSVDGNGDGVMARDLAIARNLTVSGTSLTTGTLTAAANAVVGNNLTVQNDLQVDVDGQVDGDLNVDGTVTAAIVSAPSVIGSAVLDSQGLTFLTGILLAPQIVAHTHNYSPTGLDAATIVRLDSSSNFNISGMVPGALADGRIVILSMIVAATLTLLHEDTGSDVANRFRLGGSDIALQQDDSIILWYDGTSSRWRAIGSVT